MKTTASKSSNGKNFLLRKPRAPVSTEDRFKKYESWAANDDDIFYINTSVSVPSAHREKSSVFSDGITESAAPTFPSPPPPNAPPTLASPPPSAHTLVAESDYQKKFPINGRLSPINKEERYVLDPLNRQKTQLGTYIEGKSIVQQYKNRGPAGLPVRAPCKRNPPQAIEIDEPSDSWQQFMHARRPQFTLKDFMRSVSRSENISLEKVENVVLSRHNYKKIQNMIAEFNNPRSDKVNQIIMDSTNIDNIEEVIPRIPQKQLLIEMAWMIKEQMSLLMNTDVKACIRPLPKYSPHHRPGVTPPHTEIILYQETDNSNKKRPVTQFPEIDSLFSAPNDPAFISSRPEITPSGEHLYEESINPSELAILDSLFNGGTALSLKAQFIAELPDISPLRETLTYLNLSFCDFKRVPSEVLDLPCLTVLKLRDNPLSTLPDDLHRLSHLRVLVFSFCLVADLPDSLYELKNLVHLDMSYNRLTRLDNRISNLRLLREMSVEGNQLRALPKGALRLHRLKYLRVAENFMHPLFWRESSENEPQRLQDLAALCFKRAASSEATISHTTDSGSLTSLILNRESGVCDACCGPMYGAGLKCIRPVSRIFGIRNMPFIFHCCSPSCRNRFQDSNDNVSTLFPEQR